MLTLIGPNGSSLLIRRKRIKRPLTPDPEPSVVPDTGSRIPTDGDEPNFTPPCLITTIPAGLELDQSLLRKVEVRVEGQLEENELAYALSFHPDEPATLHALASKEIMQNPSPKSLNIWSAEIPAHIKADRKRLQHSLEPSAIIFCHTHPQHSTHPSPSDTDLKAFQHFARTFSRSFPRACILFGIHGISRNSTPDDCDKDKPKVARGDCLVWSTCNAEHALRFFDINGRSLEVHAKGDKYAIS